MAETITKTINWSDLFNAYWLGNFLGELRYLAITDVEIDSEFRRTTINGTKTYDRTSLEKEFEIIPNRVRITTDKSFEFFKIKIFSLNNFSEVVKFLINYCSYIYDYIQDQHIEYTDISTQCKIHYPDVFTVISEKLDSFTSIENWLERMDIQNELCPLILASLIQKFYQQDSCKFNIKINSTLSRIKSNINHINSLLDYNVDLLKSYKLNLDLDVCVKDSQRFEFLNNLILRTMNFSTYNQNMDIKFLSYISRSDLKEKAINAENHSNIL